MVVYLSECELEVVRLLHDGMQPKDIAKHLNRDISTIKHRFNRIFRKCNIVRANYIPHIRLLWLIHTGEITILKRPIW